MAGSWWLMADPWPWSPAGRNYCAPQLHDRFSCDGIDQVGRNRGERLQDEYALAETRMRHSKPRLVDDLIACENEVEIECPRRIRARARATVALFDSEKRVEQLARRARRAADARGVQIEGIVFQARADRRRFDQERQREFRKDAADLVSRGENGLASVSKIASEGDRDRTFGLPSSALRPLRCRHFSVRARRRRFAPVHSVASRGPQALLFHPPRRHDAAAGAGAVGAPAEQVFPASDGLVEEPLVLHRLAQTDA